MSIIFTLLSFSEIERVAYYLKLQDAVSIEYDESKNFNELDFEGGGVLFTTNKQLVELEIELTDSFTIVDLGLNIIFLGMPKYFASNSYPIFYARYHKIEEFSYIEALISYKHLSMKSLPTDIMINKHYGIDKFTWNGTEALTKATFNNIVQHMSTKKVVAEDLSKTYTEAFIILIADLHPAIINTLYMLGSITKFSKLAKEFSCWERAVSYTTFKFEKRVCRSYAYWFKLPKGAILFTYSNGEIKYSNFAPAVHDFKIENLKALGYPVHGYLHDGGLYVFNIEHKKLQGKWTKLIALLNRLHIDHPYQDTLAPTRSAFFFVEKNDPIVYKNLMQK